MEAIIDYRGKTPTKTSDGVPLITAKIIKNGTIEKPFEFISEQEYSHWMTRGYPRSGDVLLTTEAPLGEVAQLTDARVALAQRVILLRGKPGVLDNRYLKFLLCSNLVQERLHARASGSTVSGIKQSELRKVLLPLPSISEQNAIAAVLGSLDDKIELNRKMSATLEAMARAIFRTWFVDFDAVRAKSEGRSTGLATDIDVFFPSSLCDSAHGEIPTGWQWLPSSEAMDVNPSRSLAGIETAPYLDMANVPTQGFSVANVIKRRVSSGSRFKNGDTLLARITPCLENGKTAFVDFLNEGEVAWGSTEFIVIHPRKPLPAEYGYLLAREEKFRNFVIGKMTGSSGRQRVPVDALNAYLLACPPDSIAKAFSDLIVPIFKRVTASNSESRTLSALRDALLPKLISGELRVSDAERILGMSA